MTIVQFGKRAAQLITSALPTVVMSSMKMQEGKADSTTLLACGFRSIAIYPATGAFNRSKANRSDPTPSKALITTMPPSGSLSGSSPLTSASEA